MKRIGLVEIKLLAGAIDRAACSEEIARHASLLGKLRDPDRGVAIDRIGRGGIHFPHRVIRDRRQMHDAIMAGEILRREVAHILVQVDDRPATIGSQAQPSNRPRSQPVTVMAGRP